MVNKKAAELPLVGYFAAGDGGLHFGRLVSKSKSGAVIKGVSKKIPLCDLRENIDDLSEKPANAELDLTVPEPKTRKKRVVKKRVAKRVVKRIKK